MVVQNNDDILIMTQDDILISMYTHTQGVHACIESFILICRVSSLQVSRRVLNMRIDFRPAARIRLFYSLTAAFGPLRLKEQEEQKKAQIKEKEEQKKSRWVKNLSYLCQWIIKTFQEH